MCCDRSAICPAVQATTIWDAGTDMYNSFVPGPATNPNGPWSYGTAVDTSGTITSFSTTDAGMGNQMFWNGVDGYGSTAMPMIAVNTNSVALNEGGTWTFNLAPKEIAMQPGNSGSNSVSVRWTAPAAGTYNVAATWTNIANGGGDGVDAILAQNGTSLFSALVHTTSSTTEAYATTSKTLTLAEGDTLDFLVDRLTNYNGDSMSLDATVTSAPEPSAMVLLAAALLSLLAYAWRKRR